MSSRFACCGQTGPSTSHSQLPALAHPAPCIGSHTSLCSRMGPPTATLITQLSKVDNILKLISWSKLNFSDHQGFQTLRDSRVTDVSPLFRLYSLTSILEQALFACLRLTQRLMSWLMTALWTYICTKWTHPSVSSARAVLNQAGTARTGCSNNKMIVAHYLYLLLLWILMWTIWTTICEYAHSSANQHLLGTCVLLPGIFLANQSRESWYKI